MTDHPEELSPEVDLTIPWAPERGNGFAQKLSLDLYSPFNETIFIDSDCLVVRDIEFMWSLFADVSFGVCGRDSEEGTWFGANLPSVRSALQIEGPLPLFNGGLMYWKSDPPGHRVFSTARDLAPRYHELGFAPMRGSAVTDEPLISLGLALEGRGVVPDGGATMRTPLGMTGELTIDVIRGRSHFVKEGTTVSPAVVHFCGEWTENIHYRRETLKINVIHRAPIVPPILVSKAVDVAARTAQGARRMIRRLEKRRPTPA